MKQFNKIAALLLALVMMLSLTILPALADDGDGDSEPVANDSETLTSVDEGTGEEVDFNDLFDGEESDESEKTDGAGEDVSTTGAEETTDGVVTTTAATETKGLSTNAIIWIVVGGVVLVAAVVLCIIFREKVGKFFRVYKSEIKKVVWLPWDQTKKSTLVVLVILIICATAICLVDLGLSKGFLAFLKLFQKA